MKSRQKKSQILHLLDYFFVLRPMLFYPGWSTLLAGYLIVFKDQWFLKPDQWSQIDFSLLGQLFLVFAMAMGGSFLLNQLADVESDLKNQKLFLISEGHLKRHMVWLEVLVLFALALIGAFRLSFPIFANLLLFMIITGYFYNFAPFKFKDRPWWSLWANMAMGFLAFVLGWLAVFTKPNVQLLVDALPYLFFNTALYLFTTLPDVEGDRIANKQTLAVRFGFNKVVWGAFAFYLLSLVSALLLQDRLALLVVLPALPFFMLTIKQKNIPATIRATKFSILFFALSICLKIPFYFILMLVGFYFTRWYFKRRFNYDYPNFQGKG